MEVLSSPRLGCVTAVLLAAAAAAPSSLSRSSSRAHTCKRDSLALHARLFPSPSPHNAVLVAEMVHHYFPRLVQVHNYAASNSVKQKLYNWHTLQQKVFKRMRFAVEEAELEAVAKSTPGAIEMLLLRLRPAIEDFRRRVARPGSARSSRGKAQSSAGQSPPPNVPQSLQQRGGGGGGGSSSVGGSGGRGRLARGDGGGEGGDSGGLRLLQQQVETDLLVEKEKTIRDLRETVEMLELKVEKMSQLVRLKQSMIDQLRRKLDEAADGR